MRSYAVTPQSEDIPYLIATGNIVVDDDDEMGGLVLGGRVVEGDAVPVDDDEGDVAEREGIPVGATTAVSLPPLSVVVGEGTGVATSVLIGDEVGGAGAFVGANVAKE
jgi:hypothetical protein